MSAIAFVLLVVFALATLGVLAIGVFGMMKGGAFNQKYANQLMRARVLCQFMAVVFFALFMLTAGG